MVARAHDAGRAGGAGGQPVTATAPRGAAARWRRAARALAPARALVAAVEISHPLAPAPARAVNDTRAHILDGVAFPALRFGVRIADDREGQPPRAELWIDNVGRPLTQWIEAARGAAGARARILQASADPADPDAPSIVEWERTLELRDVRIDRARVTARLGAPSLRGRAAVIARHDPARSPGLF